MRPNPTHLPVPPLLAFPLGSTHPLLSNSLHLIYQVQARSQAYEKTSRYPFLHLLSLPDMSLASLFLPSSLFLSLSVPVMSLPLPPFPGPLPTNILRFILNLSHS